MKKISLFSMFLLFLVQVLITFCSDPKTTVDTIVANGSLSTSSKTTIGGWQISLKTGETITGNDDKDVVPLLEKIKVEPIGKIPSKEQIRKLAGEIGLLNVPIVNPKLKFEEGDISFWYEEKLSMDRLYLEFSARKIVLDIADRKNIKIIPAEQGELSALAGQVMVKSCAFKEYREKIRAERRRAKTEQTSNTSQKSRIVITINMDGYIVPVSSEDVNRAKNLMRNSPIKKGRLSSGNVKKLAKYYGLLEETATNPQLSFLGGDIAYWAKHGENMEKLNREFASRLAMLDAADRAGIVIADQGKLSWAAEQLIKNNIL
ncbi:MAG: hypothetical protein KAT34_06940 [Candidatus Aminicenantes bacterium]|nr:hypothetical protein [Candidatus Aminicenantes bacterium]